MSARELFNGGFGVLAVTPITAPEPPDTALIQGLFDLTPAEARVAVGIVAGMTIKEMADCHANEAQRTCGHRFAIERNEGTQSQPADQYFP
jgi:hypothetical protein